MPTDEQREIFDGLVSIGEESRRGGDEEMVDHVRAQLAALQGGMCADGQPDERCPDNPPPAPPATKGSRP